MVPCNDPFWQKGELWGERERRTPIFVLLLFFFYPIWYLELRKCLFTVSIYFCVGRMASRVTAAFYILSLSTRLLLPPSPFFFSLSAMHSLQFDTFPSSFSSLLAWWEVVWCLLAEKLLSLFFSCSAVAVETGATFSIWRFFFLLLRRDVCLSRQ